MQEETLCRVEVAKVPPCGTGQGVGNGSIKIGGDGEGWKPPKKTAFALSGHPDPVSDLMPSNLAE